MHSAVNKMTSKSLQVSLSSVYTYSYLALYSLKQNKKKTKTGGGGSHFPCVAPVRVHKLQ